MLAILLWRRFVFRECGSLEAESAANCFQTQLPNILVACLVFVPCALVLGIHLARANLRTDVTGTIGNAQTGPDSER